MDSLDNTSTKEDDVKREPCVLLEWIVPDGSFGSAGLLIEQLRYANLVHVVKESTDDLNQTVYMLELVAPKGMDQRVWVDQNAKRMQSFGLNAQASWKEIK